MEVLASVPSTIDSRRPKECVVKDFDAIPVLVGVGVVAMEKSILPEAPKPLELDEVKRMAGIINRGSTEKRQSLSEIDRLVLSRVKSKTLDWRRSSRSEGYTKPRLRTIASTLSENTTEKSFVSNSSGREPLLTNKGESFLSESYVKALEDGDMAEAVFSRNMLIMSNLRLVVSLAGRYMEVGSCTFADYVQEGNMGLEHTVDKFDPERGFKLSTYATWWIRQYINRFINHQSNNIRLPDNVHNSIAILQNLCDEAGLDFRSSSPDYIAEITGISSEKIKIAQEGLVIRRTVSLDRTAGDEGTSTSNTLLDALADPTGDFEYNVVDNKILVAELFNQLEKEGFTAEQIDQLRTQYFNKTDEPLNYVQLGSHYKKTGQAVGRSIRRTLKRIKEENILDPNSIIV